MGVPFCVKHFAWGASCEDTADSDVEILESVDFDVYGGVKGEVGEVPDVDMSGISLVPEDAHEYAPEDAREDAPEDVAIEKQLQCANAAVADVDDASPADAASLQPLQDATKTADVPSPKRRKVRKKRQAKAAQTAVVAETPLSQQCKELPELLKERLQQIYFDERF